MTGFGRGSLIPGRNFAAGSKYPEFPDWVPPTPATDTRSYGASSRRLSRTQTTNAERRVALAAAGAALPIAYGRVRMAPLIGAVAADDDTLVVQCIWCAGEIEAVEAIYIDGEAMPAAVTATHYTGTTTQTADSTLGTLVTDYADTMIATTPGGQVGVAYSVLEIPASVTQGWPRIEGVIQGRQVYDPRTTSTAYSTNPALHLADYLSSSTIGMGLTVDWDSVDATADECDDTMSDSSKRREAGILIDQVAEAGEHAEVLRTYAGCLIVQGQDGVKLVPNRPVATSRALTAAHVLGNSLRLSRRPLQDVPTQVEVSYTDTSHEDGWRDSVAIAAHPGVAGGTVPRRVARVAMPGIQSHAQAYREAVERLNAASLSDLRAEWITTDEALADEPGDVIALTHPIGLTSKTLRILAVEPTEPGRWRVTAEEYDADVYSDDVVDGAGAVDTGLPSPLDPPTPSTPTLTEELYTDETGTTYSRLRVTWTGSSWPYARQYRVVVTGASVVVDALVAARGTDSHSVVTPPVTQDVSYTAQVWVVSSVGAISETPSSNTATAVGKLLAPTNVGSISGFEAGQFVALQWQHAEDIDLRGYQVRRLPDADYTDGGASDWSAATVIAERVDATTFLAFSQPEGVYHYGVKALDSVGNESASAAWTEIDITADTASTAFAMLYSDVAESSNIHCYELDGVGRFAVSSDHGTWADRFGVAGTAWSTGATTGKLWAQEHSISGGVEWNSHGWDTGASRVANWSHSTVVHSYGSASPSRKILVTESGENLFANSSDMTDTTSAWLHNNVTVTQATGVTAPDRQTAVYEIREQGTVASTHRIGQAVTVATGTDYTFSVYAKYGSRRRILLYAYHDAADTSSAYIDLVDVAVDSTSNCTATIESVGDGWYRVAMTCQNSTDTATTFSVYGAADGTDTPTYNGNTSRYWYLWGAQIEAGSAATQYILTDGTAHDGTGYTEISGSRANRAGRYMAARVTEAASGADDVVLIESPITASRQGKPQTLGDTESVAGSLAVTFDTAFTDVPNVSVTLNGSAAYIVAADSVTATGFTIYVFDWDTGTTSSDTVSVSWTATGS